MSRGRPYTQEEDEVILSETATAATQAKLRALGYNDRSDTSVRARRQALRKAQTSASPSALADLLAQRKKLEASRQRLDNALKAQVRANLEEYLQGLSEDERVAVLQEFLKSDD